MNNQIISKIFKDKLGYKVLSIKDSSKGVDQNVKIVNTNNGKYILKIPHREKDKIIKEVVSTNACIKIRIPVPKVIYYDNNILIETYIEGKDLGEIHATKKQYSKIYYDLGKILKKIHSIKCKGFGSILSAKFKGKYSTQKQSIESYMPHELLNLKKSKIYSDKYFLKITNYYAKSKNFLNVKNSVMIHSDYEEPNILIKNNKIAAIIDFGDLAAGSPMQDIARMYVNHYETYRFDEFIKGYGKHDLEEIKFHTFCYLTWRIASYKNRKNKFFKRMTKTYRDIWDQLLN